MTWLKSADKALFGWGSPVTFGVVRMVTGFLALVNFLMISIDFEAWYTEKGFVPVWHSQKLAGNQLRFDLLWNVTDSRITAAFYVLLCVACLFTFLGLFTRIASIAMFLLIVTFHHRNTDILHSGDTLLRQMAFFVMIAPSGKACSLDRVIGLWRGKAPIVLPDVSIWPQRLMQFQVTIVYFTTVWHKWTGTHWRDGTATWFVPQLHEFDRFPMPPFVDQQPFVMIATYGTLLIELGVAFLAYAKPMRRWILLAGVFLHAGIEYRFNIPLFSFIMCSTYLAFYDGEEFSAFARRIGERFKALKVRVFVPKGRVLQPHREAALESMDCFSLVEFEQGHDETWAATGADGKTREPYSALVNRAPVAWFFKLVPRLWKRTVDSALEPVSHPKAVQPEPQAVNS